ncbi:MAG TPA: hypothetical protein PK537_07640 [Candidatus Limiplasma sp.]|nr:hypothetical protein [Candidatus Limiplasma sp.]
MKRWICTLLAGALILTSASAGAMGEYTLSPFEFDTQAMLELAFGDQAADAQLCDDREYPFYDLNTDGVPFCGQNDTYGFGQMDLSIYTALVASERHEPGIYENIEPSGVADCDLTPEQAQADAEAWLLELGITDSYLQSVTAYGAIESLSSGYMVAFGQALDGVPVYWAAATHNNADTVPNYCSSSNRIEVVVGDSGLIRMSGFWCAFTPTTQNIAVISQQEAIAAFTALGEQATDAELCYLLTGTHDAARAIPAYRWQNRFLSAEDGSVLQ